MTRINEHVRRRPVCDVPFVFGEDLPRTPDLLVSLIADGLRTMARPWLRVRALVNYSSTHPFTDAVTKVPDRSPFELSA